MKYFAFFRFAIALVGLAVATADAQDQPATSEQRSVKANTAEKDSHEVVEGYIAAVLAGQVEKAKASALSLPFGKTDASTRKNIERLRQFVGSDSLAIEKVLVSQQKHPGVGMAMALAMSAPIKFAKPPVTGLHDGRIVFSLFLHQSRWRVVNIEYLTQDAAEEKLDHFKQNDRATPVSGGPAAPAAPVPDTIGFRDPRFGFGHSFPAIETAEMGIGPGGYTTGNDVVLYLSKKGDAIWGFSKATGRWAEQALNPPVQKKIQPVIASNVSGLQLGNKVYAFSIPLSRWDVLEIPEAQRSNFSVGFHDHMVLAQVGSKLFVFSAATGRWTSPGTSKADASMGGVSGIDSGIAGSNGFYSGGQSQRGSKSWQLAQQLRRLKQTKNTSSEVAALEKQLRESVVQEFVQRQARQRAEVVKLKQRFERIERLIESREKNKDRIIDRRIEELLNPALRWDTKNNSTALVPQTSDSQPVAVPQTTTGSLREILRAHWKAVEAEYKVGKRTLADVMRAALQYQQYVIDTANGEQEQQDARRAHIAMLRDLRRVLEAMYRAGKASRSELLETDAALRKAEAQWKLGTVPPATATEGSSEFPCRMNLKRLAVAFHGYHADYKRFPPAAITHKNGKILKYPHSWRVAILPFLGRDDLYHQYHFDEPWDSENNRKVLGQMPDVFRHPGGPKGSTNTAYFALVGPRTVIEGSERIRLRDCPDGTSNTILLAEAKRDIPWTKPEDISCDPKKPFPTFGEFHQDGFHGVFADGAVRFIPKSLEKSILRALIERNDGKIIPPVPGFRDASEE